MQFKKDNIKTLFYSIISFKAKKLNFTMWPLNLRSVKTNLTEVAFSHHTNEKATFSPGMERYMKTW